MINNPLLRWFAVHQQVWKTINHTHRRCRPSKISLAPLVHTMSPQAVHSCSTLYCRAISVHTQFNIAMTKSKRESKPLTSDGWNYISQTLSAETISNKTFQEGSSLYPSDRSLWIWLQLTFILPTLTQHFLLNVKWLSCWWRPVGIRDICQESVQHFPNHASLRSLRP